MILFSLKGRKTFHFVWNFSCAEFFVVPHIPTGRFWQTGDILGKGVELLPIFFYCSITGSCLMWDGNVRLLEVKIRVDRTEWCQAYF